jgi:hypothetical protein
MRCAAADARAANEGATAVVDLGRLYGVQAAIAAADPIAGAALNELLAALIVSPDC